MQFSLSFALLFGFWIVLSGKFDAMHLAMGVVSSALIAYWSGDLLFAEKRTLSWRLKFSGKFWWYWLWLNWQIVIANFQVLILAFHPNVEDVIEPQILEFETKIKDEFGQFVFANSITLTPGTIFISSDKNRFKVHALTKAAADALPGDMEDKVMRVVS